MSDDKNKIARYSASVPDLIFADPPVFGDVEVVLLSDHEAEVAKYRDAVRELLNASNQSNPKAFSLSLSKIEKELL